MIRPNRVVAMVLSIVAIAVVLLPASAEAQLGRLARKARDAAQGKAEEKVEDALPFTPAPAPAFDDRTLEVTEAQLGRMLAAFDAEISYAGKAGKDYKERSKVHERAMKDFQKALEAYDKKNDKYEGCVEDFRAKEEAASAATEVRIDKPLEEMNSDEFEAYMADLAERGERISRETLQGRTDADYEKRLEEYTRDIEALLAEQGRRAQLVMSGMAEESERADTEDRRLIEACGEAPVRPIEPQSELTGPEGALAAIGAETAELTAIQYAVMRERVLYWSRERGRPSGMGFSEGEMAVLTIRKADLERVVERMRKAKIPV